MENFSFGGGGNGMGGGQDLDFSLNTYIGTSGQMTPMATMGQHQSLNDQVQGHETLYYQVLDMNHNLNTKVIQLEERVKQLEDKSAPSHILAANNNIGQLAPPAKPELAPVGGNTQSNASPFEVDSNSIKRVRGKRYIGAVSTGEVVTKAGLTEDKKPKLKISSETHAEAPGASLLTPMQSAQQMAPPTAVGASFTITPRTPFTPGRIGPPEVYKKTATSVTKRVVHNLNKSMPPAHVQLPMLPLTDTEIVVYFFNSLSKPMVSLRLYARGWSPASIVQCINDHRHVDPPYLRNTASVKCTTAIKLGKKLYGNDWEDENRAVFTRIDDTKATDLIRANEKTPVDYFVRALGCNIKKHPVGEYGSIFTSCVKYCIKHNAPYTMSNVVQLAMDIQDGKVPQHPKSPILDGEEPEARHVQHNLEDDDLDGEYTEDDAPESPTPLAGRASVIGRTGGTIDSALNKRGENAS